MKNCPFCGSVCVGLAWVTSLKDPNYIVCYACKAQGPLKEDGPTATSAWNIRPTPQDAGQGNEAGGKKFV